MVLENLSEIELSEKIEHVCENEEIAASLAENYWGPKIDVEGDGNPSKEVLDMRKKIRKDILKCNAKVGGLEWHDFLTPEELKEEEALFNKIGAVCAMKKVVNCTFYNMEYDRQSNTLTSMAKKMDKIPTKREKLESWMGLLDIVSGHQYSEKIRTDVLREKEEKEAASKQKSLI